MFLPKLFNHGTLRSIKTDNGKLVLEGTYGKEEFEGGSLPEGGKQEQVLMIDDGVPKWLWLLPPGTSGKVLTKTGTGAADIAWMYVPSGGGSLILNFEVRMSDVSDIGSGSFYWGLSDVAYISVTSMLGSPAAGTVVELRNGIIGEDVEDGEETNPFATTAIWRDGTQTEFQKALIAEFGMPVYFTSAGLTYTVYMTISYNNGTYAFEGARFSLAHYNP